MTGFIYLVVVGILCFVLGLLCVILCDFSSFPWEILYLQRLGRIWGFKILNFYSFGGFQEKEYFGEIDQNFVDIFGGVTTNSRE